MFKEFFDNKLIVDLCDLGNLFTSHNVSPNYMTAFLTVRLISDYSTVPWHQMMWYDNDDVYNAALCQLLTRKRLEDILKSLNPVDNCNLSLKLFNFLLNMMSQRVEGFQTD